MRPASLLPLLLLLGLGLPASAAEGPDKVGVRHILIPWKGAERAPADVTRTKEEAKKLAEEILGKLGDKGDFGALAKEFSSCPSKQNGGTVPLLQRGRSTKAFEEAAFALKVGERSGLVETEFGYHIIERVQLVAFSHIFVPWKGAERAPPEVSRTKEEARARVEEAAKKLEGGTSFADVAKEFSEDGSKNQGGGLGVHPRGAMVPALETAALALEEGKVSGPVESPFGWHLLRRGYVIRASHILVSWKGAERAPADVTRTKEEAKKLAEETVAELGKGGDFAKLAAERSTCNSKTQGGDLGTFGPGEMVPAFLAAAEALKPGQVSGLVETEFGYHIIRRTE
jgi:parvulin-like peptidyl-prolyl isomerase